MREDSRSAHMRGSVDVLMIGCCAEVESRVLKGNRNGAGTAAKRAKWLQRGGAEPR